MRDSRGREADLSRFVEAHDRSYSRALEEIREGRKQSHWMWYIFPQIVGLGLSSTSRFYAIADLEEARAYMAASDAGSAYDRDLWCFAWAFCE